MPIIKNWIPMMIVTNDVSVRGLRIHVSFHQSFMTSVMTKVVEPIAIHRSPKLPTSFIGLLKYLLRSFKVMRSRITGRVRLMPYFDFPDLRE